MNYNGLYASAGASGGFSFAALLEWAKSPSTVSGLAFIGSAASTLIGWLLARRAQIARANFEIERERRAMEREQRYLDAIAGRTLQLTEPPR